MAQFWPCQLLPPCSRHVGWRIFLGCDGWCSGTTTNPHLLSPLQRSLSASPRVSAKTSGSSSSWGSSVGWGWGIVFPWFLPPHTSSWGSSAGWGEELSFLILTSPHTSSWGSSAGVGEELSYYLLWQQIICSCRTHPSGTTLPQSLSARLIHAIKFKSSLKTHLFVSDS